MRVHLVIREPPALAYVCIFLRKRDAAADASVKLLDAIAKQVHLQLVGQSGHPLSLSPRPEFVRLTTPLEGMHAALKEERPSA